MDSIVTNTRAKQRRSKIFTHEAEEEGADSELLLNTEEFPDEMLIEEVSSLPDMEDIDLDQMLESLAVPELLSPLSSESSVHSESGYDSCSCSSPANDLTPDSLTDLFPDLAFDPTSSLLSV